MLLLPKYETLQPAFFHDLDSSLSGVQHYLMKNMYPAILPLHKDISSDPLGQEIVLGTKYPKKER